MTKTITIFGMLLLFAGAVLTPAAAAPLESVRVQLKWKHQFQFAGYYAAIEQGYYKEVGLDVELLEATQGQQPVESVLDGAAQYGVGTTTLLLNRAQGDPIVVLAAIFQHSPMVLIARRDSWLQTVHDLKGKQVMIEPHSSDILMYLQLEGLATNHYSAVPHSFNIASLLEREVDAMTAYVSDELYQLRAAGMDCMVVDPRSGGIDFYGDCLFTTENQIREHPEQVQAFLEASLRGWTYAMAHPEEVVDLILDKYSTRHSREHLLFEAQAMQSLMNTDLVAIGHMYPGRWQHIADVYTQKGWLTEKVDLDSFIYQPEPPPENNRRWWLIVGILTALIAIIILLVLLPLLKLIMHVQASEKRFLSMIYASHEPIMLFEHGKILDCNDATACLLGYAGREELLQLQPAAFSPPTQPDSRTSEEKACEMMQLAFTNGHHRFEWVHRTVDGIDLPIDVTLTPVVYKQRNILYCQWRDLTEIKQAENALRTSQERFQSLFECAPTGIFHSTEAGRFLVVNPALAKLLGYAAPEEMITAITDIANQVYAHPEQRQHMLDRLHASEGWVHYEAVWRRKDGQVVVVENMLRKVTPAGKPIYFEGFSTDISARKTAETTLITSHNRAQRQRAAMVRLFLNKNIVGGRVPEALQELTRTLTTVLGVQRAGVWKLSEDGGTLHGLAVYDAATNAFLQQPPMNTADFPHYFDALFGESRVFTDNVQDDPRTNELMECYLKPNNVTALLDAGILLEGKLAGVVCIENVGEPRHWHADEESFVTTAASIAAQLFLVAERNRQEDKLRTVSRFHVSAARLAIANANLRIDHVDEGLNTCLAILADFMAAQRAYIFSNDFESETWTNTHEWCAPQVEPMIEHLQQVPFEVFPGLIDQFKNGKALILENLRDLPESMASAYDLLHEQGIESLILQPMLADGELMGFVGFDDIHHSRTFSGTELALLRLAADNFAATLARHRQYVSEQEAKGNLQQLLHILCHDLANPVGNIQALLDLIGEAEDEAEKAGLLNLLRQVADSTLELIDRVRYIRALEEGRQPIETRAVNLLEACTAARQLVHYKLKEKDIALHIEVAPSLSVDADPTILTQTILCNLLTNAAKFSHPGSTVYMRATREDDGHVCLEVQDQGIGMDARALSNLFNPKAQVSQTGTAGEQGTGFGMLLIKRFLDAFHADIQVVSRDEKSHPENHGTTVTIRL